MVEIRVIPSQVERVRTIKETPVLLDQVIAMEVTTKEN
jgi:hypothetical protein